MERVRVSAETAVQIIKNGGMLILTDDETRENEGDLVVASEFITAEHINFMAKYGKGLICVSLPAERFQIGRAHVSLAQHLLFLWKQGKG